MYSIYLKKRGVLVNGIDSYKQACYEVSKWEKEVPEWKGQMSIVDQELESLIP